MGLLLRVGFTGTAIAFVVAGVREGSFWHLYLAGASAAISGTYLWLYRHSGRSGPVHAAVVLGLAVAWLAITVGMASIVGLMMRGDD